MFFFNILAMIKAYYSAGNENRLFEFKEDIPANQFTPPTTAPPNYTTIIDIDGNTVNYVGKYHKSSLTGELIKLT